MSTTQEINDVSAGAFAERLLGIVNDAALALMISVGHRTRLFDVMATLPASTSEEIARAAGLDERYVREWLGSVATGGIVEYDPERRAYRLPAEHAAFLTRAASPNNFGVTAQFIAVLGAVEDRVVDCFAKGGGVPYSAYARFHEVMAEESDQTVVAALFDAILPLAAGMEERLEAGVDVLDVGCGSGRALAALAARFPKSRFVGYDFSEEAIGRAAAGAAARGLTNVRYEVRDAADLGDGASFDLVTAFDAIHDQAEPGRVLGEVARVVRDDGVFLMVDIEGTSHVHEDAKLPLAPFGYAISCMHCMTVSLANGGAGLGAMWGRERALAMLAEAGFANVETHNLEHDVINVYYVARKQ